MALRQKPGNFFVTRTVAIELLLLALLPVNLVATAVIASAGAARRVKAPKASSFVGAPMKGSEPKTILLSGGKMTKSLALARSFHRAGHRVILVETAKYRLTGHRFSRHVDQFHTIPDPGDVDYLPALINIIERETVDVFVPVCSPAASRHDALAKAELSKYCEVIHVDADVLERLDDKFNFAETAASIGLKVPDTYRITDSSQVTNFDFSLPERQDRIYVLKSIAYDPIRRLDLTPLPRSTPQETASFVESLPISQDNPWILQEFIVGQEYCTHGTVRNGNLQLHGCCKSSAFQINYEMVEHPEIERWVRAFVGALALTGQVSLDFIEDSEGTVFAIECNPRTHSAITMFYDHPDVARAYLDDHVEMVVPSAASRPTYWLYHELWRMATRPSTAIERLKVVLQGKDAIFDLADPLPFLMVHHLHIPSLLISNLFKLKDWIRIDFNIGKLVEPGGD